MKYLFVLYNNITYPIQNLIITKFVKTYKYTMQKMKTTYNNNIKCIY